MVKHTELTYALGASSSLQALSTTTLLSWSVLRYLCTSYKVLLIILYISLSARPHPNAASFHSKAQCRAALQVASV